MKKAKEVLRRDLPSIVDEFLHEHKQAYSQGFEEIYALEKIDIKSLKRIGQEPHDEGKQDLPLHTTFTSCPASVNQTLFCPGWDFFRDEPIEVLDLPQNIVLALKNAGKIRLRDLLQVPQTEWAHIKGVGSGHLEDIWDKLQKKQKLGRRCLLDVGSLIRALLGDLERQSLYFLLQGYGLQNLVTLSLAERASLKHLSAEACKEVRQRAFAAARQPERRQYLLAALDALQEAFLRQWMQRQKGIAWASDILFYLQQISQEPAVFLPVFSLLSDLYFDGSCVLSQLLHYAGKDVYLLPYCRQPYDKVQELARGCFYRPGLEYPLNQLVDLCLVQAAQSWLHLDRDFVEKSLKMSAFFFVYKACDNLLWVKKSFGG